MGVEPMEIGAGPILTAALAAVGGVIWLVRLEGRQNVTESRFTDLRATVEEIRGDVKELLRK